MTDSGGAVALGAVENVRVPLAAVAETTLVLGLLNLVTVSRRQVLMRSRHPASLGN